MVASVNTSSQSVVPLNSTDKASATGVLAKLQEGKADTQSRLSGYQHEMKAAFETDTDLQFINHADAADFDGIDKKGFHIIPNESDRKAFEADFTKALKWLSGKQNGEHIIRSSLKEGAGVDNAHMNSILDNLISQGKLRKEENTGYFKN
ncbi:MAG TPA: hypothetical protein DHW71_07180 [Gammaproteobacteria bacterium]|nr:hypothetical protein [Gammaproteobacteria bacterium]MEC8012364.1 hypothetical protein [Pseudomonadota bacterium]HBF08271.1 hypothetical protein [Gammaproteobacteria bacterium]HCK92750.1 hypothetical protein [Gammaproteobacteria bacterium]|tara:strand:+ start:298 stop:747 length:450 start_codon:yes stop_codon:yes gene_type:complete